MTDTRLPEGDGDAADPVRLLLVDHHPLFRDGLRAALRAFPGVAVVAEAASGADAVALHAAFKPDVTLLELHLPDVCGAEVIARIRAAGPAARVVVLTACQGSEDVFQAFQAGAAGYLFKDATATDLVAAVGAVHAGRRVVPAAVAAKLAERAGRTALTLRELAVLREVAAGRSNKQIASALGVSEETVKTHVRNIFEKLGVADRLGAVTTAVRRGIIRLG